MNVRSWIGAGTLGGVLLVGSLSVVAQQGTVERIGESLDNLGRNVKKGAQTVASDIKAQFSKTRESVHSWGVESRVYGRLHWDQALTESALETHVDRSGVATLSGVVPDAAARAKAVLLARETVGVTKVIDQLSIGSATIRKKTTTIETTVEPKPE